MKIFILTLLFLLIPLGVLSQSSSSIKQRCPSPYGSIYSNVLLAANGNIQYNPCPTKKNIFTGIVDFSGATITGAVTGTGTTNFIPRWTSGAAGVIGNTPFSWNGTQYEFQNTALNSTFSLVFNPTTAGGIFSIGGGNPSYLALTQAPSLFRVIADNTNIATNAGGLIEMGDLNTAGSGLKFTIDENGSVVAVNNDLGTAWFTVPNIRVSNIVYNRNDCIAGSVLNLAGESDLSGSACWGAATSPVMFVSGNSAAGALRVQAGVVKSSLGAGDAGGTFNYVIIDVQ